MFRLIILPVVLGIGFYFYFFFKRFFKTLFRNPNKRTNVVIALLSAFIAILCFDISSLAVVVILHILIVSAIILFLNFILKLCFKDRYKNGFKIWKKISCSEILSLLISMIILVCGAVNMFNIQKTQYTIYTNKNIREDGYKVALLADIHYGVSLDENALLDVCKRVSDEKPDIVVLGGDIVDDSTTPENMEKVFEILGNIESKYGIFYVFGNHDRPFSMLSGDFTERDLVCAIESNGIIILKDQIYNINSDFAIVGREDKGYGDYSRKSIGDLIRTADKEKFILTVDHRPTEYAENGEAGTDLIISGHTHGGQIWPVNIIDNLFKINDANYGNVEIDSDTQAIVTSGVSGWAYPVKTSAPSEFVIIDILKQ